MTRNRVKRENQIRPMVVYFPLAIWKSDLASEVQPLTLLRSSKTLKLKQMKNKDLWKTVIQFAISILTAALTAMSTTSCMGYGPLNI